MNITQLAKECIIYHPFRPHINGYVIFKDFELTAFANAIVEECAKQCDMREFTDVAADAIRALKDKL